MTGRARVTSRSMWTDEGRLLAHLREAAEKSVEGLENGARLSAVERTAASAVRFRVSQLLQQATGHHRRRDRGTIDPESQRRLQRAKAEETPEGGTVGASGTKYRPRARTRATTPSGVRPLRRSDGPKGDGGGGNRHLRSDPTYQ